MTKHRSEWQESLNPKLVKRLNKSLTIPGVINQQMARQIIERSPDLYDRLPLLARQLERWSSVVDLETENTPIVYAQRQDLKSAEIHRIARISPVNLTRVTQPLPVVVMKPVRGENSLKNQDIPLVRVRQPTPFSFDASLPRLETLPQPQTTPITSNSPQEKVTVTPPPASLKLTQNQKIKSVLEESPLTQNTGDLSPHQALQVRSSLPIVYEQFSSSLPALETPLVNPLTSPKLNIEVPGQPSGSKNSKLASPSVKKTPLTINADLFPLADPHSPLKKTLFRPSSSLTVTSQVRETSSLKNSLDSQSAVSQDISKIPIAIIQDRLNSVTPIRETADLNLISEVPPIYEKRDRSFSQSLELTLLHPVINPVIPANSDFQKAFPEMGLPPLVTSISETSIPVIQRQIDPESSIDRSLPFKVIHSQASIQEEQQQTESLPEAINSSPELPIVYKQSSREFLRSHLENPLIHLNFHPETSDNQTSPKISSSPPLHPQSTLETPQIQNTDLTRNFQRLLITQKQIDNPLELSSNIFYFIQTPGISQLNADPPVSETPLSSLSIPKLISEHQYPTLENSTPNLSLELPVISISQHPQFLLNFPETPLIHLHRQHRNNPQNASGEDLLSDPRFEHQLKTENLITENSNKNFAISLDSGIVPVSEQMPDKRINSSLELPFIEPNINLITPSEGNQTSAQTSLPEIPLVLPIFESPTPIIQRQSNPETTSSENLLSISLNPSSELLIVYETTLNQGLYTPLDIPFVHLISQQTASNQNDLVTVDNDSPNQPRAGKLLLENPSSAIENSEVSRLSFQAELPQVFTSNLNPEFGSELPVIYERRQINPLKLPLLALPLQISEANLNPQQVSSNDNVSVIPEITETFNNKTSSLNLPSALPVVSETHQLGLSNFLLETPFLELVSPQNPHHHPPSSTIDSPPLVTSISEISTPLVQRFLNPEVLNSQNLVNESIVSENSNHKILTGENLDVNSTSEIPIVYEQQYAKFSSLASEAPLIHLTLYRDANSLFSLPEIGSDSLATSILETIIPESLIPETLTPEITSSNLSSEFPVVYEQPHSGLGLTPLEIPLVNLILRQDINSQTSSSFVSPLSAKSLSPLVTPIQETAAVIIQHRLNSDISMAGDLDSNSKLVSELPIVYEQPRSELSFVPLEIVNLISNLNPQQVSSNDNVSVIPEITETFNNKTSSLNLPSALPVVSETHQLGLSNFLLETPFLELVSSQNPHHHPPSSTIDSPPLVTSISEISTPLVQRFSNPEVLNSQNLVNESIVSENSNHKILTGENLGLNFTSEIPIVYEQPRSELSFVPLEIVNLISNLNPQQVSSNDNVSVIPEITETFNNETSSLNLPSALPVVSETHQLGLSNFLLETPFLELVSSQNPHHHPSSSTIVSPSLVTSISEISTPLVQRFLNPEVLNSQNLVNESIVSENSNRKILTGENLGLNYTSELPVVYAQQKLNLDAFSLTTPFVLPLLQNSENLLEEKPISHSIPQTQDPLVSVVKNLLIQHPLKFNHQLDSVIYPSELPVVYEKPPDLLNSMNLELVNALISRDSSLAESLAKTSVPPTDRKTAIEVTPVMVRQSAIAPREELILPELVYSQPLLGKIDPTQFARVAEQSDRKSAVTINPEVKVNSQTPPPITQKKSEQNLPLVQLDYEQSILNLEPLVLSNYSTVKQTISSLKNHLAQSLPELKQLADRQTSSISNYQVSSPENYSTQTFQENYENQNTSKKNKISDRVDIDALVDKVERKIMRRLVVESERRGKKKWR